jgi:2-polyprenyl-6-hydroxyphenyl methylase/3-demethylubiquinone-9 3-methyltransferase
MTPDPNAGAGYSWADAAPPHTNGYLLPTVRAELAGLRWPAGAVRRIFDLGCGNGAVAADLARDGYAVTEVDPSADGIQLANQAYPGLALRVGSAYDDLAAEYGRFPAVVSLEVVEHVYYPRRYARCLHDLLEPGGVALVSTPYHSYLKNLALAVSGKLDGHFTALWDYGHIKFWSVHTLSVLMAEAGLKVVRTHRVGRVAALAKSMVLVARRPG